MRPRTLRARVALWNTGVLALLQLLLLVVLSYGGRRLAYGSVDRELSARGRRMAEMWSRTGGRGAPRERSPDAATGDTPKGEPPKGEPPKAGGFGRGRWGPRFMPQGVEERQMFLWRPRFVDFACAAGDEPWDAAALEAVRAGRVAFSTVRVSGEHVRVFTVPLRREGKLTGAVQLGRPLRDYDRFWHGLLLICAVLLPLALALAALGGVWVTDRALGPVRAMTAAAAELSAADLSRRLVVTGDDELVSLARTFNGMLARLSAAFDRQRRFTADASHELRTPLARIKVTTSLALGGEPDAAEDREALRVVDQAAEAMQRLVEQLLVLARADEGQLALRRELVEIAELLDGAVASLAPAVADRVTVLPASSLEVLADGDSLRRLLVNLLENSVRHTPPGGQVTVAAEAADKTVLITVTDTGEGIAPEHLPQVGERFYRVDDARCRRDGGAGLGLAIARAIAEAHGGELAVSSELGQGTTVSVRLPLTRPPEGVPEA